MVIEQSKNIINEVKKAFFGNDEVIKKVLMTIYAGGHVLLEDCPGVGKTTLALAFSKVMGLDYKRIQFTTDTMPSDITGFTMYNKQTNRFEYIEGAANCQLLLADEINRTSPKTQAALLEVMEEHSITVDGQTHMLPEPFVCIATQNPVGTSGTHPLPESQLDRFMVCISIGYPSSEDQAKIIKAQRYSNPLDNIQMMMSKENVVEIQQYINFINANDDILSYIITLCEKTRALPLAELGVSPRGVIAVVRMSKAYALISGRNYVIPEDVQAIFADVCAHRMVLKPQARVEGVTGRMLLDDILKQVKPPEMKMRSSAK